MDTVLLVADGNPKFGLEFPPTFPGLARYQNSHFISETSSHKRLRAYSHSRLELPPVCQRRGTGADRRCAAAPGSPSRPRDPAGSRSTAATRPPPRPSISPPAQPGSAPVPIAFAAPAEYRHAAANAQRSTRMSCRTPDRSASIPPHAATGPISPRSQSPC